MGWEYHERRRARDGTFVPRDRRRKAQLHLRVTPRQAELIRNMAVREGMGLTTFVLTTIHRYYTLVRHASKTNKPDNG